MFINSIKTSLSRYINTGYEVTLIENNDRTHYPGVTKIVFRGKWQ